MTREEYYEILEEAWEYVKYGEAWKLLNTDVFNIYMDLVEEFCD